MEESTPLLPRFSLDADFQTYESERPQLDLVENIVRPHAGPHIYLVSSDLLQAVWKSFHGNWILASLFCSLDYWFFQYKYPNIRKQQVEDSLRIRILWSKILLYHVPHPLRRTTSFGRLFLHDLQVIQNYYTSSFCFFSSFLQGILLLSLIGWSTQQTLPTLLGAGLGFVLVMLPTVFTILQLVRVHHQDMKKQDNHFVDWMMTSSSYSSFSSFSYCPSRWSWWWALMTCTHLQVYILTMIIYSSLILHTTTNSPITIVWTLLILDQLIRLIYQSSHALTVFLRYKQSTHRLHTFLTKMISADTDDDDVKHNIIINDDIRQCILMGTTEIPTLYQEAIQFANIHQWSTNTRHSPQLSKKECRQIIQARDYYHEHVPSLVPYKYTTLAVLALSHSVTVYRLLENHHTFFLVPLIVSFICHVFLSAVKYQEKQNSGHDDDNLLQKQKNTTIPVFQAIMNQEKDIPWNQYLSHNTTEEKKTHKYLYIFILCVLTQLSFVPPLFPLLLFQIQTQIQI
jgi:hypothetical protein